MNFEQFLYEALKHQQFFKLGEIIRNIYQDIEPSDQKLFLFIHLDEIQKIVSSDWHGPNERKKPSLPGKNLSAQDPPTESGLSLLKDILGTYVQTFVSGTARRAVVEAAEPTGYHIHPLSCITMASRMEIIEYFMDTYIKDSIWKKKLWIFELLLLSDTGGLPRAIQYLLDEFFGTYFQSIKEFCQTLSLADYKNDIFPQVATRLNTQYHVKNFAYHNQKLVSQLIYQCINSTPFDRREWPSSNPSRTYEDLEQETHVILVNHNAFNGDTRVKIEILFFFIYLYNKVTQQINGTLVISHNILLARTNVRDFESDQLLVVAASLTPVYS
ncbi:11311_t:CDS:2 [Paraglomus occultum]|uniref:11311_t:CDS:1 n=1 Tax=Paraglomus occultum TaxID=144539 RepID=A0A9N8Z3A5_9GLOM|nr:11311_t:CDS:2 [Paraglomus occultum]